MPSSLAGGPVLLSSDHLGEFCLISDFSLSQDRTTLYAEGRESEEKQGPPWSSTQLHYTGLYGRSSCESPAWGCEGSACGA